MSTVKQFEKNEDMQQGLAEAIAKDLEGAIAKKGAASLVVSGGSTPKRLFQILSTVELDWEKVTVTLADDRWLEEEHVDSNERLVKENLLQGAAKNARFIGLKTADETPFEGAKACHDKLEDMMNEPFDVTLLGMGTDGHTASLFPCSDELGAAVEGGEMSVQGVTPRSAPYQRMTLTLPTLMNSAAIYLQLAGASKLDVYQEACGEGDEKDMPIRYFIRQDKVPMSVYWAP